MDLRAYQGRLLVEDVPRGPASGQSTDQEQSGHSPSDLPQDAGADLRSGAVEAEEANHLQLFCNYLEVE